MAFRSEAGHPGIQLSNFQSVRSDDHGVYILFTQISALGVDRSDNTVDADVISEIYIPKALVSGFVRAVSKHLPGSQEPESEEEHVEGDAVQS